MKLSELKEAVYNAIEGANEYGENPDEIVVTLHITTYLDPANVTNHETVWASEDVELHYDNNGIASGCVITAAKEIE